MKTASLFIFFITPAFLFGQSKSTYKREFSVLTDNDVFFYKDYYYSAGQDLAFKTLLGSNSRLKKAFSNSDTSKVILIYKAGIKIYTPHDISQTDLKRTDRPYAGWDYVSVGAMHFNKADRGFLFNTDLGIVGKASGMGQFQAWWHKVLGYQIPRGWNYQIRNELVINLNYLYWRSWALAKKIDLVSTSDVALGTGLNQLSQDLTVRFLNFRSLKYSTFSRAILSSKAMATKEFFLFAGLGIDYVASNIFIEGSLLEGNKSPFTLRALPIVFRQKIGAMYSTSVWSYSITANHLSREVSDGIDHFYGSVDIGFRF